MHIERQEIINFTKKYLLIKSKNLRKGKGRLFILFGWHKEGIKELWDQKVFSSISYPLSLGIFLSLPLSE